MTIQMQGHVESVERGGGSGRPGRIAVTVILAGGDARSPITLFVPESDAKHWLVGHVVQLTAYAYEYKKFPNVEAAGEMIDATLAAEKHGTHVFQD